MPNKSAKLKIKSLKRLKSAYILEAKASKTRGWDSAASALFLRAGQLEMELVELFRSQDDEKERAGESLKRGIVSAAGATVSNRDQDVAASGRAVPRGARVDRRVRRETKRSLGGNHHGTTGFDRSSCQKKLIEEGEWAEAVAGR